MKKITKLITISCVASASLYATPPTSGDILRQVQQPKVEQIEKAVPKIESKFKAPIDVKDDVTVFIKSFIFSGNIIFTSDELSALLKSYENTQMGMNKLKSITSIITKHYRDKGYFVARAYIPQQTIKDGVVEIAIIEGTYGGFEIKNSSLVDDSQIQGFMDHLKNGQIVSTPSLERQMLLINDLSGVIVTNAEVFPGTEVGTSNFTITTSPMEKYSGYAVTDNYGSRYTGEYRLSLGANVNSLSGIGDTLSLNALVSNTADLKNAGISYARPLGYSGFKGSLSASITDYELDEIPNYIGYGSANNLSANISYPLLKTRSHIKELSLGITNKTMKDTSGVANALQESKKSINSLMVQYFEKQNTSIFDHSGKLFTTLSLSGGDVNMDNDIAKTNDLLIDTQGRFTKANANLTHAQQLNEVLTLQTTLKGQKSFGKNLDSSEDFSVSGSNGVRSYEDSELSGDQGASFSFDFIYSLPKYEKISHNTSLFIDSARVWKNDTIFNNEDNIKNLNAIGIGYSLNYDTFDVKATLAHGFGGERTPSSESEFSTNTNKFLIQAMARF